MYKIPFTFFLTLLIIIPLMSCDNEESKPNCAIENWVGEYKMVNECDRPTRNRRILILPTEDDQIIIIDHESLTRGDLIGLSGIYENADGNCLIAAEKFEFPTDENQILTDTYKVILELNGESIRYLILGDPIGDSFSYRCEGVLTRD
ncbi:MAG: hypothetical protein AAF740_02625 [Bacteroidota bacterium]